MVRQRWIHDAIVKIRIDDDYHTYGRIVRGYLAVYDYRTRGEDIKEMNDIISRPVLFIISTHYEPVTRGRWVKVGKAPAGAPEITIPDQFKQNLGNPEKCEIVDEHWNTIRVSSPEECEGLEEAGVWSAEHVEERLRDYYAGRRNVNVEYSRPRRRDVKLVSEKLKTGNIVKIKFDKDRHIYGRLLEPSHTVAVYDCSTNQELEVNEIISMPVLFVVSVYEWTMIGDRWIKVGEVPAGAPEVPIPDRFYQDYFDPAKCWILHGDETTKATIDGCEGLERATIWEPEDVEERIRDHYAGRKNRTLEYWKLRYPSGAEPPKPPSERKAIDLGIRRRMRIRPAKSLDDYDYDELKNFFKHIWELVLQESASEIDEKADPIKSLEQTEKESMASAKKGVILGIQDLVYAAKDIERSKRGEYDRYLKSKGAVPFTEMRRAVLDRLFSIFERDKIEKEEEYYLLKEAVSDVDDRELKERSRERAEELLEDFESKMTGSQ